MREKRKEEGQEGGEKKGDENGKEWKRKVKWGKGKGRKGNIY